MNEEKLKMYLTILNDENPIHVKENAQTNIIMLFEKQQKEIENIKEYINSPEFLDWNLGFKLIDELEYRKDRINELLGE